MRVMHRKRRGFRRLGRPVFGRGYALPQITSLQENHGDRHRVTHTGGNHGNGHHNTHKQ